MPIWSQPSGDLRPYGLSDWTSVSIFKAFILPCRSMVGSSIPPQPPIQLGDSGTLKEEIEYRTRAQGSWKNYFFWLMLFIAFIVFLYLLGLVI